MNTWLNEGEKCLIPLASRYILQELVRRNVTIIFDNTEAPISGTKMHPDKADSYVYKWIMRVRAPVDMGGRLELLVTDDPNEYEQVADQVLRYLRWLQGGVK